MPKNTHVEPWRVSRTLQEDTQRKPFWSYKYNYNRNLLDTQGGEKRKKSDEGPSKKVATEPGTNNKAQDPQEGTSKQNQQQQQVEKQGMSNRQDQQNEVASGGAEPMDQDAPANPNNRVKRSAGGFGAGSGGQAGLRGTVQWPDGERSSRHVVYQPYKKNYFFRVNSQGLKYKSVISQGRSYTAHQFPVFEFKIDNLAMYLSKEQIAKIFQECNDAEVVECSMEIYTRTATLPFITNQTTTSLGNNNVGVYICQWKEDINKYRTGIHEGYGSLVGERVWGKHLSQLQITSDYDQNNLGQLGAEFVTKDWPHTFTFEAVHGSTSGNITTENAIQYNDNMFPWRDFLCNYRNATFDEGLYATHVWKPKDGTIHNVSKNTDWLHSSDPDGLQFGHFKQLFLTGKNGVYTTGYSQNRPLQNILGNMPGNNVLSNFETYVHPSERLKFVDTLIQSLEIGRNNDVEDIPVVSIGIDPLYSGELRNQQSAHIDAKVVLELRCKLIMKETRSTSYQHPWGGSLVQPDTKFPKMVTKFNDNTPVPNTRQQQFSNERCSNYSRIKSLKNHQVRKGPVLDLYYRDEINNPEVRKYRHYHHDVHKGDAKKGNSYNLRSRVVEIVEKETEKYINNDELAKVETKTSKNNAIVNTISKAHEIPQSDEPSFSKSATTAEIAYFNTLSDKEKKANTDRINEYIFVEQNGKYVRTSYRNPYYSKNT